MKCPIHKDVELIQNVLGGIGGGTWYHCYKCWKTRHEGSWTITELMKYLSKKARQ